jgi:signal transduction histidine kinase
MPEVSDLYHHIIHKADIGIIILSVDNRVVCWNEWMEKASGVGSEESLGKDFFSLFPQCGGGRFAMALEDALQNGVSSLLSSAWNYYTLPLHQPQNVDILMMQSLIIKPIEQDDARYCCIEVFDVTNSNNREALLKVKTEESLKAREAAELASRTKSEFVSTVSHELRTPLTSISGSLDLILGGVVGKVSDKVQGLIEIASNNTQRLLSLINDLLDIEKIEAGKMEFIFSQVELNQLIVQVMDHNQTYASQHQVHYVYHPTDAVVYVNADAHRLSQVIANLLSNAAKFSYPHLPIDISLQLLDDEQVRVSVSNEGEGIPEGYQDTIFDRFMQVKERGDNERGSGLGLNISKAIIEHHGGEISFTSIPGQITTFYFILPRTHPGISA